MWPSGSFVISFQLLIFWYFLSCWFYDTDLITRIVYDSLQVGRNLTFIFLWVNTLETLIKWGWRHQIKLWKTVLSSFDKYSRTKLAGPFILNHSWFPFSRDTRSLNPNSFHQLGNILVITFLVMSTSKIHL